MAAAIAYRCAARVAERAIPKNGLSMSCDTALVARADETPDATSFAYTLSALCPNASAVAASSRSSFVIVTLLLQGLFRLDVLHGRLLFDLRHEIVRDPASALRAHVLERRPGHQHGAPDLEPLGERPPARARLPPELDDVAHGLP